MKFVRTNTSVPAGSALDVESVLVYCRALGLFVLQAGHLKKFSHQVVKQETATAHLWSSFSAAFHRNL